MNGGNSGKDRNCGSTLTVYDGRNNLGNYGLVCLI